MKKYDAILIPGGGLTEAGEVQPWVTARLDIALAEFSGSEIVITMSKGTTHKAPPYDSQGFPITEARAGADYLNRRGVAEDKLRIEQLSLDTIGNAYFTRVLFTDVFKLRKLLVVTSEFHMPRTRAIFEWVYGLDIPMESYELEFRAAPNVGLDEASLDARLAKETKAITNVEQLRKQIVTFSQLHNWIYTKHDAYRLHPLSGSTSQLEQREVLGSY